MKYLFGIILIILVLLSGMVYFSLPDVQSEVPVLYWVTDPNPARSEQVDLFHEWLVREGHAEDRVIEDAAALEAFRRGGWARSLRRAIAANHPLGQQLWEGEVPEDAWPITVQVPAAELRLDSVNRDTSKQIIQGVSGVGGDIMDISRGGNMRYFRSMGIIAEVTEPAARLGFDVSQTYEAVVSEIAEDGEQYMFPCNVGVQMLWVNRETFARHDQPLPPARWDVQEFEERGRAFVEAANPPGRRQSVFFVADVDLVELFRSTGLSVFNETLTRCTLDDERFVRALELKGRWIDMGIMPSAAQREAFDTASGYGGAQLQLFNRQNYAMVRMGRFALIQLREFGELDLDLIEPPHAGLPNVLLGARGAGVYAAGEHQGLAHLFLAYLASEEYNMQIVRSADALPPNPAYTQREAFLRPPDYPNEWRVHEAFLDAVQTIGVGGVYSPFVLDSYVERQLTFAEDAYLNGRLSAEGAARLAAERINAEIDRHIASNVGERERYNELAARQREIDRRRGASESFPLSWIENPFLQRYEATRREAHP